MKSSPIHRRVPPERGPWRLLSLLLMGALALAVLPAAYAQTGGETPPSYCEIYPQDPACVNGSVDCEAYPSHPACERPAPDCEANPDDPACERPAPDCEANPDDPACETPTPDCEANPDDPACEPPTPDCEANPDDPACQTEPQPPAEQPPAEQPPAEQPQAEEPQPDPLIAYDEAVQAARINGQFAGSTILTTCLTGANGRGATNNQRFQADCNLIVGGATGDEAGSTEALDQLSGEQVNAQNSLAARVMGLRIGLLRDRLARLRGGAASADAGSDGPGAELSFGPLSVHFNARYFSGDANETALQPAYDTDGWTLLGGADYRFTDQLIGGIALNYANSNADFSGGAGNLDGTSLGVSFYGSYNLDNGLFFDGLLGYASNDYSMIRRIDYTIGTSTANQDARSDPSGESWNLNIGTGYTFYREAWAFTPSLRLNWLQTDIDSYSERMSNPTGVGGSMALALDGQSYTSFTSDLGIQVTRAISTRFGVVVPQLRVGWVHEFDNGDQRVGGRFVNDINAQSLTILTQGAATDYADVALGVSAQFANGRSAFLNYNTVLGYSDASYNAVTAGVRVEF